MGSAHCSSALHSPSSVWRPLVQGKAGRAGPWFGLRNAALGRSGGPDCDREPDQHPELAVAQAGSDNPAVAVRAWRNKGYLSMAPRSTEITTNADCGGARDSSLVRAPKRGSMEREEPDASGNSRGNGDPVGIWQCPKCQAWCAPFERTCIECWARSLAPSHNSDGGPHG